MNPILRKSSTLGKIILKPLNLSSGGKKFVPCSSRCICLIYLDLNEIRSQNYYQNCFREKVKKNGDKSDSALKDERAFAQRREDDTDTIHTHIIIINGTKSKLQRA